MIQMRTHLIVKNTDPYRVNRAAIVLFGLKLADEQWPKLSKDEKEEFRVGARAILAKVDKEDGDI